MSNALLDPSLRQATVAHEMKHLVDLAHYANGPAWLREASGTWAESRLF